MPEKTQRIISLYNVEEKEAVKMMADTDKRRMTNYNFYTDQKWGKASNYTLCLNSSQLGYDRCEKIIMEWTLTKIVLTLDDNVWYLSYNKLVKNN